MEALQERIMVGILTFCVGAFGTLRSHLAISPGLGYDELPNRTKYSLKLNQCQLENAHLRMLSVASQKYQ